MSLCSVVIPAHNEEAVIARCLDALVTQATESVIDIVVVCNGCTDRTADIVRSRADTDNRIRLIELTEGSKIAAIRAGLAAAPNDADVVATVDADVVLSTDAIDGLLTALSDDQPLIGAPSLNIDLTGCSWAIRRYYAVWAGEPYAASVIGAGVYAVNRAGLDRIIAMPDVIADDAWARAQFLPTERKTSAGTFTVYPARTLRPHVKRGARIVLGNRQLAVMRATAGLRAPASPPHALGSGRNLPLTDKLTYRLITRATKVLASWRELRGHTSMWSSDPTSRSVGSPT
jgi:glycosyltransferase involved in cell wall biosynthesis